MCCIILYLAIDCESQAIIRVTNSFFLPPYLMDGFLDMLKKSNKKWLQTKLFRKANKKETFLANFGWLNEFHDFGHRSSMHSKIWYTQCSIAKIHKQKTKDISSGSSGFDPQAKDAKEHATNPLQLSYFKCVISVCQTSKGETSLCSAKLPQVPSS